ncbi:MAG: hypothetical protein U9Q06_03750 [Nanoarchaeota archaeon]|nr:hypothetical protein [Nanoarchaeota archaeon]
MINRNQRSYFNARERLNICAGITVGALIPIIATKYLSGDLGTVNSFYNELSSWSNSALESLPYQVLTAPLGFFGGVLGAIGLKMERGENRLENQQQEQRIEMNRRSREKLEIN